MTVNITILGSTGSIGVNTLDVIDRHPDKYSVFALSAHSQIQKLARQCMQFKPQYAVVANSDVQADLQQILHAKQCPTEVLTGVEGLCEIASADYTQVVMAAIVGAAGLLPTLAAVKAGKRVLLANKEALVMSGEIFMAATKASGAEVLPIDSEHNAIFQCLPSSLAHSRESFRDNADTPGLSVNNILSDCEGVRKILLTASGGPFWNDTSIDLHRVTPDQACKHPNWQMGRKISVDSATMMNKGLELIEACWLFNMPVDKIQVLIHPQSIVHSMVEYVDGSVLAQMGNPDMRTPIAHALAWPQRIISGVGALDLIKSRSLEFYAADFERFPCLKLALDAAKAGGTAGTLLNAANEVAVQSFLNGQICFTAIAQIIQEVMETIPAEKMSGLEHVQCVDEEARQLAKRLVNDPGIKKSYKTALGQGSG